MTLLPHRSTIRGLWALILALAGVASFPVAGHTQPPQPATHQVDPVLEPAPFVVDALNLTFNLPRGASTIAQMLNGQPVVEVRDSQEAPTWTMRVQTMKPKLDDPSAKAMVDDLLSKLTKAERPHTVLVNEARTISGIDGWMCFLDRQTRETERHESERFISGWLVLPIAQGEFMVFAVQTLPEQYETLRPIFEACFGTIALKTREQALTERAERLKNGYELLKAVSPEQLKALCGYKQWSRIYKPADNPGTPSTEFGCALIEVVAAKRGALNPARDETKYTGDERKDGLLVRVQGRYIADAQRRVFYDSVALYWMAWDQSDEAWSVRGTQRQGEAERSEAETGVRGFPTVGQPIPTLQVIKQTTDGQPVPNEWEVPDVYLSQALGWIIGRLLPRDIDAPLDYAWYFYVASHVQPKVYQRLDRWAPSGDGSLTLTTWLTPETPSFTTTYSRDGQFLRRTHSDGSITEPIELEELRRLWKARGIPVTADDR